jgi:hypothetical protein
MRESGSSVEVFGRGAKPGRSYKSVLIETRSIQGAIANANEDRQKGSAGDAPALKKAGVGFAVSAAIDAARGTGRT